MTGDSVIRNGRSKVARESTKTPFLQSLTSQTTPKRRVELRRVVPTAGAFPRSLSHKHRKRLRPYSLNNRPKMLLLRSRVKVALRFHRPKAVRRRSFQSQQKLELRVPVEKHSKCCRVPTKPKL